MKCPKVRLGNYCRARKQSAVTQIDVARQTKQEIVTNNKARGDYTDLLLLKTERTIRFTLLYTHRNNIEYIFSTSLVSVSVILL